MNKEIKLSEITLNITDGKHGDCINEANSGYYFISVKDLNAYEINYGSARQITENDFLETHKRTKLEVGDILLANSGHTIGKMLFVKDTPYVTKTTFQKSVALIKPNRESINGAYLYYNLLANVTGLKKAAVGSAQPNLLLGDLRDFKVQICKSIYSQSQIAKVLSDLDAKIELNNKINAKLETMAKLIYDYWFVQFDFPNTEGKPYKSSGGKMVYNEELKREIPEGWEVSAISDLFVLKRGYDLPLKDRKKGTYPLVSSGGVIDEHNQARVKGPGIVTGRSGQLGKVFYVADDFWPLNTSLYAKEFKIATPTYTYFYLKRLDLTVLNSGSAVPTLNRNHLHIEPTELPPKELIKVFEKLVGNKFLLVASNQKQNQQLASLRDWLLPMLMNGQVTSTSTATEKEAEEKVSELGMAAEPKVDYGNLNK